jgi:hypothetical protein
VDQIATRLQGFDWEWVADPAAAKKESGEEQGTKQVGSWLISKIIDSQHLWQ